MADNTITHGAPGIAEFNEETWANATEILLQDTPPPAFMTITLSASGSDIDLAINSVIAADGSLAAYSTGSPDSTDAVGITRYPIFIADGDSLDVQVMVQGNVDINALVWDSSFDTDAKKKDAFNLSTEAKPFNMILGSNPYDSDGVLA